MSETPVRVAIFGACGRLGRAVTAAIAETDDLLLVAAITAHPEAHAGEEVAVSAELPPDARARVFLDVTAPAATAAIAEQAAATGAGLVVAATALEADARAAIDRAATRVPVVVAPNLSTGVSVLHRLVAIAAASMDADVEIVEAHHGGKRDAPSGTALQLARAIEAERGSLVHRYGREGSSTGRPRGEIGIHAVRGGDVAGEHQVLFLADGERLELVHRASSRRAFALGALRAMRFAAEAPAGRYDMRDVLGLSASP